MGAFRKSKPWSKLQSQVYGIWCKHLDLQMHCMGYPLSGSSQVGRYWITLGKEIIWDVPKDFPVERRKGQYNEFASEISCLIRTYLDTPKDALLSMTFSGDRWGLIDIMRVADRRLGMEALNAFARKGLVLPAAKVLAARRASAARVSRHRENATVSC